MKSLYESILDDEGILIQKVKEFNWFKILENILNNGSTEKEILNFLNSKTVVDNIKPMFKNFKDMEWIYYETYWSKGVELHNINETENFGGSTNIMTLSVNLKTPGRSFRAHIANPESYFPKTSRDNMKLDKFKKWKKQLNEFELFDKRTWNKAEFLSHLLDRQIDYKKGKVLDMSQIHKDIMVAYDFTRKEKRMFIEESLEKRLWGLFIYLDNPGKENYNIFNK
jgi:hypothetical protein